MQLVRGLLHLCAPDAKEVGLLFGKLRASYLALLELVEFLGPLNPLLLPNEEDCAQRLF